MFFKKNDHEAPHRNACTEARAEQRRAEAGLAALKERRTATEARLEALDAEIEQQGAARQAAVRGLADGTVDGDDFDGLIDNDATLTAKRAALVKAIALIAEEIEKASQRVNEARQAIVYADNRLAAALAEAELSGILAGIERIAALHVYAHRIGGTPPVASFALLVSRTAGREIFNHEKLVAKGREILAGELN